MVHFLNTSRDGDSTTSLGSLFQCLTTKALVTSFCPGCCGFSTSFPKLFLLGIASSKARS